MGRHSAPDDGPEDVAAAPQDDTPTAVITAPGRHARSAAGPTEVTGPVTAPPPVRPPAPRRLPPPPPPPVPPVAPVTDDDTPEFVAGTGIPGLDDEDVTDTDIDDIDADSDTDTDTGEQADPAPHGSSADLALVRRHGDVRARVAAAVTVPLVLYAVVLLIVGATLRQALLWVFVPLVVAGVLAGFFLDVGHRQHAQAPPPAGEIADEDH